MNKPLLACLIVGACVGALWSGGLKVSGSSVIQSIVSALSVNVGTTTDMPGVVLHVSSTTQADVRLTNDSTGRTATDGLNLFIGASDSGIRVYDARNFIIYTSNTEYFRVGSGGGVTFSTTMLMWSRTAAQLRALTNGGAGSLVYNSSSGALCMSSGTAAGAWVMLASTGTACDD